MSDLPSTIRHPEAFLKSQWSIECPYCNQTIGFDGVFNWGWTSGCFGETKITPTDFDGVIERNYHFLIIETKDEGILIPRGQLITLEHLRKAKSFSIMKIWNKTDPASFECIYPTGKVIQGYGTEEARRFVSNWFRWANK